MWRTSTRRRKIFGRAWSGSSRGTERPRRRWRWRRGTRKTPKPQERRAARRPRTHGRDCRAASNSSDTGDAGNVEGLKRTIVRSEDLELRRVLQHEPRQRLSSAALVLKRTIGQKAAGKKLGQPAGPRSSNVVGSKRRTGIESEQISRSRPRPVPQQEHDQLVLRHGRKCRSGTDSRVVRPPRTGCH